ncbi:MAG: thiamine ABC transporter substrate-binding protein [Roseiflexaceae bacterium]
MSSRLSVRVGLMTVLSLVLIACGSAVAPQAPVDSTVASTTAVTLTVMTHDSFAISEEVIVQFEQANNVDVVIVNAGDAGSTLNKAILTKDAPQADVLFGVDNTFLSRAIEADIFEAYAPNVTFRAEATADNSGPLVPIDFGYVLINYDKAALTESGLEPPQSLADLLKPEWKSKLVVENPATSSPGLAFFLATVAEFGSDGWQEYWRGLRANDVLVADDWSTAYYTHFSGSSGEGPRPLVVSYSTSPAAELYFSEGALTETPTGNVAFGVFRQVEYAGILKGTVQGALAQKFIDYMVDAPFQNDIPLQMFVYPASEKGSVPELFTTHAPIPTVINQLDAPTIARNRDTWVAEWDQIVLR